MNMIDDLLIRYLIIKTKMDKEEANELIKELNELSEFEEQNIERMKEIAHVLVQHYLHKDSD